VAVRAQLCYRTSLIRSPGQRKATHGKALGRSFIDLDACQVPIEVNSTNTDDSRSEASSTSCWSAATAASPASPASARHDCDWRTTRDDSKGWLVLCVSGLKLRWIVISRGGSSSKALSQVKILGCGYQKRIRQFACVGHRNRTLHRLCPVLPSPSDAFSRVVILIQTRFYVPGMVSTRY
jgi:hypothetical protein